MGATRRLGGVLGLAVAFVAFVFGGEMGLPLSVRLIVIGVGVLLAVLSRGLTRLGLAALLLGGIVVFSLPWLLEDPSEPRLTGDWRVPSGLPQNATPAAGRWPELSEP